MCIFCFLEKQNQAILREKSQIATDRFEHCLKFYKKVYINGYKKSLSSPICEKYKKKEFEGTFEIDKEKIKQRDLMKNIDLNEIGNVFDIFEDAYIAWLNNNFIGARKKIDEFLTANNLFKTVHLKNKLMFRARISENKLSHWDMFHIPFNKRFLIKNQRYSLVGRPMLYLGFSPKYVLEEIGYDPENRNCFISAFYLKESDDLKVCDFRYKFLGKDEQIADKILLEEEINDDDLKKILKKELFISIISSICSFNKHSLSNNGFCEEYVLPQTLSEIINGKEEYDGLLYTSTKSKENDNADSFLDANAVIFTKYDIDKIENVTYVYDKELYNKFNETTAKNIYEFKRNIKNYSNFLQDINEFKNDSEIRLNSILTKELGNIDSKMDREDDIAYNIYVSVLYEMIVNSVYKEGEEKNE